jgi:pimeloyl-ACP methyl ester carboxylesterase
MPAMEHALEHPEGLRSIVPGSEWALFEQSSHRPHVEEPEAFLDAVGAFLERADRRAA